MFGDVVGSPSSVTVKVTLPPVLPTLNLKAGGKPTTVTLAKLPPIVFACRKLN